MKWKLLIIFNYLFDVTSFSLAITFHVIFNGTYDAPMNLGLLNKYSWLSVAIYILIMILSSHVIMVTLFFSKNITKHNKTILKGLSEFEKQDRKLHLKDLLNSKVIIAMSIFSAPIAEPWLYSEYNNPIIWTIVFGTLIAIKWFILTPLIFKYSQQLLKELSSTSIQG